MKQIFGIEFDNQLILIKNIDEVIGKLNIISEFIPKKYRSYKLVLLSNEKEVSFVSGHPFYNLKNLSSLEPVKTSILNLPKVEYFLPDGKDTLTEKEHKMAVMDLLFRLIPEIIYQYPEAIDQDLFDEILKLYYK